jgi:hypothetical protein
MTWSSRSRRGSAWPSHSAIVQNAMLINSRSVHQQASCLTDHQPSVSRARVRILRTERGPSDISCNGLHRSHHCDHRHRRTLRMRTALWLTVA